jgi:uncharacterized coiled-coil DUF342 family protein
LQRRLQSEKKPEPEPCRGKITQIGKSEWGQRRVEPGKDFVKHLKSRNQLMQQIQQANTSLPSLQEQVRVRGDIIRRKHAERNMLVGMIKEDKNVRKQVNEESRTLADKLRNNALDSTFGVFG